MSQHLRSMFHLSDKTLDDDEQEQRRQRRRRWRPMIATWSRSSLPLRVTLSWLSLSIVLIYNLIEYSSVQFNFCRCETFSSYIVWNFESHFSSFLFFLIFFHFILVYFFFFLFLETSSSTNGERWMDGGELMKKWVIHDWKQ